MNLRRLLTNTTILTTEEMVFLLKSLIGKKGDIIAVRETSDGWLAHTCVLVNGEWEPRFFYATHGRPWLRTTYQKWLIMGVQSA